MRMLFVKFYNWMMLKEWFACRMTRFGLAQMGYEKPSTKLTFYKAFFSSQWKFLIYTILQSLSAKRTSWNEFSTAMASAVICLSKGQRFNFSMYIFDSLVRNVDSSSKFYMYPHFIQLIIQAQVVDLSSHTTRYISPALTQKVFANMRRVGKGCSGVETPLFENMLPVREEDAEEEAAEDTSILVQQVLDKYYALVHRVDGLESDNTAQKLEILKLKARVKKLERFNKVILAAELIIAAVSTPISAAKPKGLKAVLVAPTISTRKRKG
nr:hypothetical protein [Tanacetum cinerariifolium]